MIAAFTAESGNDGQSSVFAMATILLCHTASYYFANDWKSLLADYGITTFHATDFYGPRGEFRGWAKDRRALFLPDLAMSLNNLANRQSEVGQRAEALETAREAVKLYGELAGQNRAAFLPDLAMSLNNLANMQSEVGQRAEALETAREAVQLYGQLHDAHNEAFAEFMAKALWTMSGILGQLNQHAAAILSLAQALRTILPEAEKYPQAHLPLCLALARDYFAAAEASQIAPDTELLSEVMRIVGPHLPQTDSGEPEK